VSNRWIVKFTEHDLELDVVRETKEPGWSRAGAPRTAQATHTELALPEPTPNALVELEAVAPKIAR
jgi:hypothetical protein